MPGLFLQFCYAPISQKMIYGQNIRNFKYLFIPIFGSSFDTHVKLEVFGHLQSSFKLMLKNKAWTNMLRVQMNARNSDFQGLLRSLGLEMVEKSSRNRLDLSSWSRLGLVSVSKNCLTDFSVSSWSRNLEKIRSWSRLGSRNLVQA